MAEQTVYDSLTKLASYGKLTKTTGIKSLHRFLKEPAHAIAVVADKLAS